MAFHLSIRVRSWYSLHLSHDDIMSPRLPVWVNGWKAWMNCLHHIICLFNAVKLLVVRLCIYITDHC